MGSPATHGRLVREGSRLSRFVALKRKLVPQSVYRRRLAARLHELREASVLALVEVAERIEADQGSLSRIETGIG